MEKPECCSLFLSPSFPQQDCDFLKTWDTLLSPTMQPGPGLRHSLPTHFAHEKTEAHTEVSRTECKCELWDPSALKRGAPRIPRRQEGVR